jgi:hypothetical protein
MYILFPRIDALSSQFMECVNESETNSHEALFYTPLVHLDMMWAQEELVILRDLFGTKQVRKVKDR